MGDKQELFLKVNRFVEAKPGQVLLLKDLAEITTTDELQAEIETIEIRQVNKNIGKSLVITALEIISAIKEQFPQLKVAHLGEADVVIEVVAEKSNNDGQKNSFSWGLTLAVSLILFLGSGMAIINFHADVSMRKVHQQIYQLVMGEYKENPLLLQIPYSIGVACGMLIFFNGLFDIKLDDDPSPLEIEMYLYEDEVNRYSLDKKVKQAQQNSS